MRLLSSKRFLAFLLVLTLLALPALSSCEELFAETLYEKAVDDNPAFIADAVKTTNDAVIANSPLLKVVKSAVDAKKGGVTLDFDAGDDGKANVKFYFADTDFAGNIKAGNGAENFDIDFYKNGDTWTFDLGDKFEVEPFKIKQELIDQIFTALEEKGIGIASRISLPDGDQSQAEAFITGLTEVLTKAIDELECKVTKEKVKVGEKEIGCIVSTYTVNDASFEKFLTVLINGLKAEIDKTGAEFSSTIMDLIDEFIDEFFYNPMENNEAPTAEDLLNPEYIINKLKESGFTVSGTFKIAVSSDKGYIVYEEATLNVKLNEEECSFSLKVDLGSKASFSEGKKIEFSLKAPDTDISITLKWNPEDNAESFKANATIDMVAVLMTGKMKTTTTMKLLDLTIDHNKTSGEYTIKVDSDAMDLFAGGLTSKRNGPLFEIKGVLKYDSKSVDFSVTSITSSLSDEVPPFALSIKFETDAALPQAPEATLLSTTEELYSFFGFDDFDEFLNEFFFTTYSEYNWDDDWDISEPDFSLSYLFKGLFR